VPRKAPSGGLVSRGLYYPGGRWIPDPLRAGGPELPRPMGYWGARRDHYGYRQRHQPVTPYTPVKLGKRRSQRV
jgi:hypothetical protein